MSSGLPPGASIPCFEALTANGDVCRVSNANLLAESANELHADWNNEMKSNSEFIKKFPTP